MVIAAWFLAEHTKRPDMPGHVIAYHDLAQFLWACSIVQPDFGQTALVVLTFGAMLLIYGIPWILVLGLAGLVRVGRDGGLCAGSACGLAHRPLSQSRQGRHLPGRYGHRRPFTMAGLLGTGPGGGQAKQILPDAHTDFTFAVVGEEFGLIACIGLMLLFAFVVMRILQRAKIEPDPFPALAMSGLGIVFGLQAVINMGVNVSLLPAKGMTLPLHFLWRLVAHRHGLRHGNGSGLRPQAAACLPGIDQRGSR